MKKAMTFMVWLVTVFAHAQNYRLPVIKPQGNSYKDFIPKGWILRDTAAGDINADSFKDVVFVLQKRDSIETTDDDGYEVKILPRILVVAFGDRHGKFLIKDMNKRMLIHDNFPPSFGDSFQSISITAGILTIGFFYDYINGNFYGYTYRFRFQHGELELIGADVHYVTRWNMDFLNYSYNFSTKKWSLTRGVHNDEVDPPTLKEDTEWFSLEITEMRTLKAMGRPGSWKLPNKEYL
jgi:hypothetical protein